MGSSCLRTTTPEASPTAQRTRSPWPPGNRGAHGLVARLSGLPLLAFTILIASWQVTDRSEDPSGVAVILSENVFARTAGDLAQYRPFSHNLVVGLRTLEGLQTDLTPYLHMRFAQCVLIFGLFYVYCGRLGLSHRARILGIGLVAGIMSLSLGRIGPSTFSLDRFTDTVFFLIAAVLVLRGLELWIPPLMVLAIANRETAVMIPMLILAKHGVGLDLLRRQSYRNPLVIALVAWIVGAIVYLGIHAYYGPQTRSDASYFGPEMMLKSLRMPAQVVFFFAAVNLLPIMVLLSLRDADPFLRRLFWLVVPAWFAIHIWAARLGEGMLFLTPITLIIVPIVVQGVEKYVSRAAALSPVAAEAGLKPRAG